MDPLDGADCRHDGDEPAEDVEALQPDPLGRPPHDLILHYVHLDLQTQAATATQIIPILDILKLGRSELATSQQQNAAFLG